jgi:hypothetical protein
MEVHLLYFVVKNIFVSVRFQVLMAVSTKIRAFWDVAPSSLVIFHKCDYGVSTQLWNSVLLW